MARGAQDEAVKEDTVAEMAPAGRPVEAAMELMTAAAAAELLKVVMLTEAMETLVWMVATVGGGG